MRFTLGDVMYRVECDLELRFFVAEVNLTLKVDFRGLILKADCRGLPR